MARRLDDTRVGEYKVNWGYNFIYTILILSGVERTAGSQLHDKEGQNRDAEDHGDDLKQSFSDVFAHRGILLKLSLVHFLNSGDKQVCRDHLHLIAIQRIQELLILAHGQAVAERHFLGEVQCNPLTWGILLIVVAIISLVNIFLMSRVTDETIPFSSTEWSISIKTYPSVKTKAKPSSFNHLFSNIFLAV